MDPFGKNRTAYVGRRLWELLYFVLAIIQKQKKPILFNDYSLLREWSFILSALQDGSHWTLSVSSALKNTRIE